MNKQKKKPSESKSLVIKEARSIQADEEEIHLTSLDLAKRLKIHPITVNNWRVSGEGPRFFRVGRRDIRYRLVDVVEWEESRIVRSTSDS
jgi:hypothetical protein